MFSFFPLKYFLKVVLQYTLPLVFLNPELLLNIPPIIYLSEIDLDMITHAKYKSHQVK